MRQITFPEYSGVRCLMMPYVQGESESLPSEYDSYAEIVRSVFVKKGDIGFITIDESLVAKGKPQRGAHAKYYRAIHTEVGRIPGKKYYAWGGGWGDDKEDHKVTLDRDVQILLANNLDDTCALWNAEHEDTSRDGDLGHVADMYPLSESTLMKAGEVHQIGILTPHESLPVKRDVARQFLRIISSGVHGREEYFTVNPLMTRYVH